ncbi:putative disease resistance protein RGA3 [Phragmites australis]|uniref:putative disease resistance protein RGA3 n=1 Tax=Phragmites australis TaxID=29695 RepID=UPI002D777D77|nr:putative disease resistance protein RGA3 [Phragmites australis]
MEGAADLQRVLDMLRSARMEKQFWRLRACILLPELRSAVSLVHTDATVSRGTSLKLMFCVKSLAAPLRELLEEVLRMEVRAEQWHQVPAALYRYLVFRSDTIRDLRKFLRKFRSLASYVGLEYTPQLPRRQDSSSSSGSDGARARDALREPMVGRSEMLDKMVSMLLADRTGDRGLLVMPIVGGPGVGKTRLAKAIMDDDRVKHKFHVRLVVPVTRHYCLERILMLMVSPERRADVQSSPEAMAIHIDAMLSEGDYLLVLDDVWSDNKGKWQEIGTVMKALPSNGRVVLTTRTPDIAAKLATIVETADTKPFYLQPLEQEFSPAFVAKWIATCHGDWPSELVTQAGTKIASKCGGVPLLLNYARRFFCQPQGMQFWQGFLGNTDNRIHPDMFWRELLECIDDLSHDKFWQRFLGHSPEHPAGNLVSESASASYQHLPPDLRGCFLYCSMFPSDYDFDVEELADLLAAGGYIPPIVAKAQQKGFLHQLLDECFYPLQQHEYGDNPTYRMHKVLHVFAQNMEWKFSSIFRADQATQVSTETRARSSIRRASLIVHPLTASFPRSLFECKDLGAVVLLQERPMCPPEQMQCEIPLKNFQSFKFIHTLSFRATKVRMLPTKFLLPHHMKYLNLSNTNIEKIPRSISRLLSLQTLILSHCEKLRKLHRNTTKLSLLQKLDLEGCFNLVELPRGMSKMRSLEYLNVTECSSLTQLPRGMGQLKSLQMLLGYIVSYTDGSSMSELQSLANLHRLSLQSLEKVSDLLDVRYARLQHKTKLESLSLRWNMDDSNNNTPAYAVLESLQPHRRLKALEIFAYQGKKLPLWMTTTEPYLMSLVEIKLINLRSCEEVLPPLGLLPCLKIAEISGTETICSINDNFCGHNGVFPSLEKLTFSYMHNLEVWEQGHRADMFPRLAELAIIQCPKFRALHMELPSVEKLILWMSNKVLHGLKGALRGVAKNLEHISISFSEELLASSDCEGLKDLGKLTKLDICGCDELTCLPQSLQYLSSIRSLAIDNCSKLKTLPDWLENLPSLQIMRLSCCPVLSYIPGNLQQRPGFIIYVENCPNLPEEPILNFPAQSSGMLTRKPEATRVDKGKEIASEDSALSGRCT